MVLAFALVTLMPPPATLADGIAALDPKLLYRLHDSIAGGWWTWAWANLFMPLLLRPCWLVPTGLGLVLMGGALTLGSRKSVTRSHRRRS